MNASGFGGKKATMEKLLGHGYMDRLRIDGNLPSDSLKEVAFPISESRKQEYRQLLAKYAGRF